MDDADMALHDNVGDTITLEQELVRNVDDATEALRQYRAKVMQEGGGPQCPPLSPRTRNLYKYDFNPSSHKSPFSSPLERATFQERKFSKQRKRYECLDRLWQEKRLKHLYWKVRTYYEGTARDKRETP